MSRRVLGLAVGWPKIGRVSVGGGGSIEWFGAALRCLDTIYIKFPKGLATTLQKSIGHIICEKRHKAAIFAYAKYDVDDRNEEV